VELSERVPIFLASYKTAEITNLINRDSTFCFSDIENAKIICVALPQGLAIERRYIATYLKQLFYLQVLRRFDLSKARRDAANLLMLWADEAHQFVTDSEEGLSDYNVIDRVREANAAIVMASQSTMSFVPPLGRDKAKVLVLNLRNRLIFRPADEEDAVASADFIGKRKYRKISRSLGRNGASINVSDDEEYRIKPHVLRRLRSNEAVVVHCERGHRRRVLPPLEADGSICRWFRKATFHRWR